MLAIVLLARSIDALLADDAGQNRVEVALIVVLLTPVTVATIYMLSGALTGTWIGLPINTPSRF